MTELLASKIELHQSEGSPWSFAPFKLPIFCPLLQYDSRFQVIAIVRFSPLEVVLLSYDQKPTLSIFRDLFGVDVLS